MDKDIDNIDPYKDWLDDYNRDETQPFEIPSREVFCKQFPEVGRYEAVQIMANYFETKERELRGG